jgi:hypothetical protein
MICNVVYHYHNLRNEQLSTLKMEAVQSSKQQYYLPNCMVGHSSPHYTSFAQDPFQPIDIWKYIYLEMLWRIKPDQEPAKCSKEPHPTIFMGSSDWAMEVLLKVEQYSIQVFRKHEDWQRGHFIRCITSTHAEMHSCNFLNLLNIEIIVKMIKDRFSGLVTRVPGCRPWDPRFDSQCYQIFWVAVGLGQGPLSLVRKT